MQNFNYHTHTYRCGHADSSISDEEYIKMFIEKGFKKIAFTDHVPFKDKLDFRNNMRMKYSQKEEYYNSLNVLKEKYKDIIDIEIGFEFEYAPCAEEYLKELKSETNKMVLGQHFICDNDGDNIRIIGWDYNTGEDVIRYANLISEAMSKGIPDIVVHPDLYMLSRKVFGKDEEEGARIIASNAEKYGIPLEINLTRASMFLNKQTSGIAYPNKEFWKVISEYNVKVVYGVDAHFRPQINLYEESVRLVNEHLGKEVIEKLNFCDENL